ELVQRAHRPRAALHRRRRGVTRLALCAPSSTTAMAEDVALALELARTSPDLFEVAATYDLEDFRVAVEHARPARTPRNGVALRLVGRGGISAVGEQGVARVLGHGRRDEHVARPRGQ